MTSTPTMDELVAEYLNIMAEYQKKAIANGNEWRNGFIELSHAKQNQRFGEHNYDLRVKAQNTVDVQLKLVENPQISDPLHMFSALPPMSLRTSQKSFKTALKAEIELHQLVTALRKLEIKISDHFGTATEAKEKEQPTETPEEASSIEGPRDIDSVTK